MKVNDRQAGIDGVQSPIAKFLDAEAVAGILEVTAAESGDLLFFGAGAKPTVAAFLGALRLQVGRDFDLVEAGWRPLWVVDFPMFEFDDDDQRYYALHHPFTAPSTPDAGALRDDPGAALSRAYDLVLNGSEIGGGSIRIHDSAIQQAVFDLLGIDKQEAQERFGFLLDALRYGCPPHGGIAFGIDRIAAIMAGEDSIREVIAFPKTANASCLMTGAPAPVEAEQLGELKLQMRSSVEQ
jgi:aspartyl-tRNA synthetase